MSDYHFVEIATPFFEISRRPLVYRPLHHFRFLEEQRQGDYSTECDISLHTFPQFAQFLSTEEQIEEIFPLLSHSLQYFCALLRVDIQNGNYHLFEGNMGVSFSFPRTSDGLQQLVDHCAPFGDFARERQRILEDQLYG